MLKMEGAECASSYLSAEGCNARVHDTTLSMPRPPHMSMFYCSPTAPAPPEVKESVSRPSRILVYDGSLSKADEGEEYSMQLAQRLNRNKNETNSTNDVAEEHSGLNDFKVTSGSNVVRAENSELSPATANPTPVSNLSSDDSGEGNTSVSSLTTDLPVKFRETISRLYEALHTGERRGEFDASDWFLENPKPLRHLQSDIGCQVPNINNENQHLQLDDPDLTHHLQQGNVSERPVFSKATHGTRGSTDWKAIEEELKRPQKVLVFDIKVSSDIGNPWSWTETRTRGSADSAAAARYAAEFPTQRKRNTTHTYATEKELVAPAKFVETSSDPFISLRPSTEPQKSALQFRQMVTGRSSKTAAGVNDFRAAENATEIVLQEPGIDRSTSAAASPAEAGNIPYERQRSHSRSSWNSSEYSRGRSSGSERSDDSKQAAGKAAAEGSVRQWAAASYGSESIRSGTCGPGSWQNINIPAVSDSLVACENNAVNTDLSRCSQETHWLSQQTEDDSVLYVSPCLCKERIIESPFCSSELTDGLWKQKSQLDRIFDEDKDRLYRRAREAVFPQDASSRDPNFNRAGDKMEEICNSVLNYCCSNVSNTSGSKGVATAGEAAHDEGLHGNPIYSVGCGILGALAPVPTSANMGAQGPTDHFQKYSPFSPDVSESLHSADVPSTSLRVFFDVCGGPGAWSLFLLEQARQMGACAFGFGMTLREHEKERREGDWYKSLATHPSWTALWGKDGTGDVHKGSNLHHVQRAIFAFLRQKHQHRSTQQEVCEKSEDTKGPQASSTRENPPDEDPVPGFTGGVTLVVGDGGFFLGKRNDMHVENFQELLCGRLLLSEFFSMLLLLQQGGHFVLKLFDTFSLFTASLIYCVCQLFERCLLVKPVRSRAVNSERYLVGLHLKSRRSSSFLNIFTSVKFVHSLFDSKAIPPDHLPEFLVPANRFLNDPAFISSLTNANTALCQRQIVALSMVLSKYNTLVSEVPKQGIRQAPAPGPKSLAQGKHNQRWPKEKGLISASAAERWHQRYKSQQPKHSHQQVRSPRVLPPVECSNQLSGVSRWGHAENSRNHSSQEVALLRNHIQHLERLLTLKQQEQKQQQHTFVQMLQLQLKQLQLMQTQGAAYSGNVSPSQSHSGGINENNTLQREQYTSAAPRDTLPSQQQSFYGKQSPEVQKPKQMHPEFSSVSPVPLSSVTSQHDEAESLRKPVQIMEKDCVGSPFVSYATLRQKQRRDISVVENELPRDSTSAKHREDIRRPMPVSGGGRNTAARNAGCAAAQRVTPVTIAPFQPCGTTVTSLHQQIQNRKPDLICTAPSSNQELPKQPTQTHHHCQFSSTPHQASRAPPSHEETRFLHQDRRDKQQLQILEEQLRDPESLKQHLQLAEKLRMLKQMPQYEQNRRPSEQLLLPPSTVHNSALAKSRNSPQKPMNNGLLDSPQCSRSHLQQHASGGEDTFHTSSTATKKDLCNSDVSSTQSCPILEHKRASHQQHESVPPPHQGLLEQQAALVAELPRDQQEKLLLYLKQLHQQGDNIGNGSSHRKVVPK